jgi:hypothetical protein
MAKKLTREINFFPGYDCIRFECKYGSDRCIPGEGGSHGKHGLTMRFLLKGDKGAVQFVVALGWLPEPGNYDTINLSKGSSVYPSDLGYHAKEPQYEDQPVMDCSILGKCYYDGSGLNAYEPFRILCSFGEEVLWTFLEGYYNTIFEDADYPTKPVYEWKLR